MKALSQMPPFNCSTIHWTHIWKGELLQSFLFSFSHCGIHVVELVCQGAFSDVLSLPLQRLSENSLFNHLSIVWLCLCLPMWAIIQALCWRDKTCIFETEMVIVLTAEMEWSDWENFVHFMRGAPFLCDKFRQCFFSLQQTINRGSG